LGLCKRKKTAGKKKKTSKDNAFHMTKNNMRQREWIQGVE